MKVDQELQTRDGRPEGPAAQGHGAAGARPGWRAEAAGLEQPGAPRATRPGLLLRSFIHGVLRFILACGSLSILCPLFWSPSGLALTLLLN